jgi:hypothetical protein
VERRALVERERDVRAQPGLHLHRCLRPHEALAAVDVGAEAHSLLVDREHAALALPAPTLDLLGHRTVAHRKDLETARIRDDRTPPAHELVQAAHALHPLVSRLDEEVEGVAQHHLVAQVGHLGGVQ